MSAFWRCTMNYNNTFSGNFAQNVIYMEDASETMTADQIGGILDNEWWGPHNATNEWLAGWTSTNVVLKTIQLQRIAPAPPQAGNPFVTKQAFGNLGVQVKHPVLGFVFTLKDGQAGRKHRGRVYHYGAPPTVLADNGPQPGIMGPTGIPLLIGRWLSNFGPLPIMNLHWNIFHRNEQGAAQFTRVTSIQIAQRCCVQRRRNFGVGI